MKKKLSFATLMIGLSAVAGSAYASSNIDTWGTTKSSEPVNLEVMAKEKGITLDELIVQLEKEGKLTNAAEVTESTQAEGTIESNISTNTSEPVNLEAMAEEKGITLDELIIQLEKEGKLTNAAEVTESMQAEGTIESNISTNTSEPVNLEVMAKVKGITLDELIVQLEKEGKLTNAAEETESTQAEKSNK